MEGDLAIDPQTELLLRYAGLAYTEIAAIVDVAPGSVGTLPARAERAFMAEYEHVEQDHAMLR
jgi:DNA-directed RNA polymerase specialized sigma24 family protein